MTNDSSRDVQKFLARHLTFMFASQCVTMMEENESHIEDIATVHHFLASNALELFAKSFMCLRWEKDDGFDIDEINKRVSAFGHDLNRIYHYQGVGEDLLLDSGIKKVTLQKSNTKSSRYHYFVFHKENDKVKVYPIESLRYGVLTPKRNDWIITEQTKLLNLCKSVRDAVLGGAKRYLK
jgi:hypothetical protein